MFAYIMSNLHTSCINQHKFEYPTVADGHMSENFTPLTAGSSPDMGQSRLHEAGFLGSRLQLPRFWGAWLWLRDFQRLRLRLCGLPKLRFATNVFDCKNTCNKQPSFGFGFITKASASNLKRVKASSSASKIEKASAS